MIPSRLLILALGIPLAMACFALVDPGFVLALVPANALLVLVAALDAWLARAPLVQLRRECAAVMSLGRPNRVTLELASRARRRLDVEVADELWTGARVSEGPLRVALAARGRGTVTYHVTPDRRGAYALGAHVVRYASPLGLWRRQLVLPASTPVRVYPDLVSIRGWELLARRNREQALLRTVRLRGGESEFSRLRDYTQDDAYRAIDWKASARRQRLTAREYQMERDQSVMLVLDAGRLMTAEAGGVALFDHALNAALMLGHIALRGGDRVGLAVFDEVVQRFVAPIQGPGAGSKLIRASYDQHPRLVEADFDRVFSTVSQRLRKRSLVVLFTQLADDASAEQLLARARGLGTTHLPLFVLLRDDEVDALVDPRRGEDAYVRGAAAEVLRWRDGLAGALERTGALVLSVSPRHLTAAAVNRYLEVKARNQL